MTQKLTILGCGATGMAAAHYFIRLGVQVLLCDTAQRNSALMAIQENNGIELTGVCEEGPALPQVLTTDFRQAMEYSKNVLVCVSAVRQQQIAQACAPFVTNEHSFLLSPGNLGAFELRNILGEGVQIGELSDNLFPCRKVNSSKVLLGLALGQKVVAAFPAKDTPALIERWTPFLKLKPGANILETALNSPNIVSHVAGSILNAAAIERADGTFAFFRDGLSPAVLRVLGQVEQERNQVLEFLGLHAYQSSIPLLTTLMTNVPPDFKVFANLDGPANFQHRYISEDAQCGVAMLLSLGKEYAIPLPVNAAAVCIAACINSTDYLLHGRTLAHCGLTGYTPQALLAQL